MGGGGSQTTGEQFSSETSTRPVPAGPEISSSRPSPEPGTPVVMVASGGIIVPVAPVQSL